ncbi:MAG TPA: ABC transporter permease [Ignavibacteriaceae bacterium]|nr:ABC transporter permease [Ignavibacteriaceae bacterium]
MKTMESFRIGIKGLQSNKMRAALTMLGIIFGVAAVIAMMSIGEGAKEETLQQIELMGTNNIIIKKAVAPQIKKNKKASFSTGLTIKDAKAIKEINPMVSEITPQRDMKVQVMYKSNLIETNLVGTTPDYPRTFNSKIISGGFFNSYQSSIFANVCVIGYGVKEKIFRFEDPFMKKIKIGDLWFSVIGVVSPKNVTGTGIAGLGLRNFNQDIYIPITTMMYKTEKLEQGNSLSIRGMVIITGDDNSAEVVDRNAVDQLTVKVKDSDQLKEAASLISRIMERRHYGVADYEIILPEQLLEQKQKTQRIFNIVMGAIAGISLLVGGIGIMNIMLANILERTREIGVRRAVGATKKNILHQFLFEALTISVAGGLLGILVGFILTSLISTYANWNTIISPLSVALAFIVSVATGLIFGIYPAKQAAEKNPIDSLRYE